MYIGINAQALAIELLTVLMFIVIIIVIITVLIIIIIVMVVSNTIPKLRWVSRQKFGHGGPVNCTSTVCVTTGTVIVLLIQFIALHIREAWETGFVC